MLRLKSIFAVNREGFDRLISLNEPFPLKTGRDSSFPPSSGTPIRVDIGAEVVAAVRSDGRFNRLHMQHRMVNLWKPSGHDCGWAGFAWVIR